MKLVLAVFLGVFLSPGWTASPFLVYGPPASDLLQPGADTPSLIADLDRPQQLTSLDSQTPSADRDVPQRPDTPEAPIDSQRPLPDTNTPVDLNNIFESQQPDTPEVPVDSQRPSADRDVPQQPDTPEAPVDSQRPLPDTNTPANLNDIFESQQPDVPEAPVDIQSRLPDAPLDIHNVLPVVLLDRPLLVLRDDRGQYSVGLQSPGPNGQTLSERGRLISTNGGWEYVIAKSGSYSYISPEGTPISVQWEADHNGFRIVHSSV